MNRELELFKDPMNVWVIVPYGDKETARKIYDLLSNHRTDYTSLVNFDKFSTYPSIFNRKDGTKSLFYSIACVNFNDRIYLAYGTSQHHFENDLSKQYTTPPLRLMHAEDFINEFCFKEINDVDEIDFLS